MEQLNCSHSNMKNKNFFKVGRNFGNFLLKNKKPILLLTGSGLIFLVFKNSFVAFAADEVGQLKKPHKTYLGQIKEVGVSVLGLRVYWDPKATPVQKASAAGRMACCTTAIVLGAAAELYPPATYGKFLLTACCAASWTTYSGLTAIDAKNLFFGNKK